MATASRWLDTGSLKDLVRDVPDFPKPGVGFKDITPLLGNGDAFRLCINAIAERYAEPLYEDGQAFRLVTERVTWWRGFEVRTVPVRAEAE